jgi:hypothetical protein
MLQPLLPVLMSGGVSEIATLTAFTHTLLLLLLR